MAFVMSTSRATIDSLDFENFTTTTLNLTLDNSTSNTTLFPTGINARSRRFSVTQMILIAIVAGTLSVITVVGNVMVMISFKIDKQLQTISNYFLFSLAVADFTVGLISMPLFSLYTIMGYWPLGQHLCDAWLALDYLASNASTLNLLIISFDRYFSVTRPLTYRAKRSPVKAGFMIICAWGISLLLWPPWIYAWPHIEGKRTVPAGDCYIQFLTDNQYVTFLTAIAAFYVPAVIMIILYWRIWKETEKRQKDLPNLQGGKQDNSKRSTSSDEQMAIAEIDGWGRIRSSSNTISAECDVMESSFSGGINAHHYTHRSRQKVKARAFTWIWIREWCIAWWHSGHEDYESEDYYLDDTASEVGVGTPIIEEVNPSRSTSLNVMRDSPSTNTIVRQQDVRNITQKNRLQSTSRSVSSESVYTILIRLPASDYEGSSGEGPSIKMIPEHFSKTAAATLPSRTRPEFISSGQVIIRRPSNIPDVRMTLDPKKFTKQTPGIKPMVPPKSKQLKKKKKPTEKKAEKKAAKTLSAILSAFIITWLPYNILVLLKPLTAFPLYVSPGLWDFFYYLCYINSTINPVCYALCNATFRRTYVRILSCKWKKKHRMTNINRGFYN